MRRLRILTWHVHGNYLWYLSQVRHDFYLPVHPNWEGGYGGRGHSFPFAENVHEIPAEEVKARQFDCILFQVRRNYEIDQYDLLTPAQRRLPRIYLEHDPPREHPTDTRHWVDDPEVLLVHVTPFNALMWDSGTTPSRVIEHGVLIPQEARYTGTIDRGIVVINNLRTRGRRLGADLFAAAAAEVPLDLVGADSEAMGGIGEIPPMELPRFEAQYRLFFNPIRYTSLGLAVIEAMMVGMPIVGLATTEMVTVVENGVSGHIDTDLRKVVEAMRRLLADPGEAKRLGEGARRYAMERFNIHRFRRDWQETFADVTISRGERRFAGAAGRGENEL